MKPLLYGMTFLFLGGMATSHLHAEEKSAAITPEKTIVLHNGKDLSKFYTWVQDTQYEDPRQIFTLQPDGTLRISGDGYGGLTTNDEYENYHLVLVYRWGTKTWQNRVDRSRDSGLLLHCVGPDGNLGATKDKRGPWMTSIECQIIEGGVGDILVLSGRGDDGNPIPAAATCTIVRDRDGEAVWSPTGEKTKFTRGRINWFGRDPDWKDVVGVRGPKDVDTPGEGWTLLECFAKGDTLVYRVNGVVVNEATEVLPARGKILLQTECAELFVSKFELRPLPTEIPGAVLKEEMKKIESQKK